MSNVEYLEKFDDGKYHYWPEHPIGIDLDNDRFIQIPEEAEMLVVNSNNNNLKHFVQNDGLYFMLANGSSEWYKSGIPLDLYRKDAGFKILWQRQPEIQEPLDDVKWFEGDLKVSDGYVIGEDCDGGDVVNQPNHYANFSIECIDAMQAMLSKEEFIGYLRGNIFKYNWRYKLKNGIEDLKKAQWYQAKLIEVEENE